MSVIGDIIGGVGKFLTGGGGKSAADYAAGQLTYSPAVSQQNPGAFTPPSGSGIAYNYIPTGGPTVDTAAQGQLGSNAGASTAWLNAIQPYLTAAPGLAGNLQQHANVAGDWMTGLGGAQATDSGNLRGAVYGQLPWVPALQQMGVGTQQIGAGLQRQGMGFNESVLASLPQFQQILSQGLDPRGAAYQRAQFDNDQQVQAQLARAGLGSSGAGAGIAAQNSRDFNIDWQNQQLGRALAALQGFSGAMSGAGQQLSSGAGVTGTGVNAVNTGQQMITGAGDYQGRLIDQAAGTYNMGRQGAQDIYTGGQMPVQSLMTGAGIPSAIYGSYLQGSDPSTARMLQYLQQITNSSKVANDAAGAQIGVNTAQNAGAAAALAPLLQGGFDWLGNLFSPLQEINMANSGVRTGATDSIAGTR